MSITSKNEARKLMTADFDSQWAGVTPIKWQNQKFDPPENQAWVSYYIRWSTGDQETLGPDNNRKFLITGRVYIDVRTPIFDSMKNSDILVDRAENIYRGKRLGSIDFYEVLSTEIGEDGQWFLTSVSAGFQYIVIK